MRSYRSSRVPCDWKRHSTCPMAAQLRVRSCVGFSDAGNDVTLHALMRPASEKRQGTKSREVGQRWCSERYGDLMLAPIWNCACNASTTSPACLQQVRSGECNSHFVARSERNSGPSAH